MVYERAHVESVLFCELVDAAAIKIVINNIVVFPLVVPFDYAVYYLDSHFHWLFLISRWDAASAGGQPETGDHYLAGFWDVVSQAGPFGKPHPRIRTQSGT